VTLTTRPLQHGDGQAMGQLLAASSLRDHADWRQGRLYGDMGVMVLDGNDPVAGIMLQRDSLWLGGEVVRTARPVAAGVRSGASIQTMLACRTAMADAWRECDTPLIVKGGVVRDSLNELLGFAPHLLGWEVCLRFSSPGPGRPAGIRRATPADLPALEALYTARARGFAAAAVRSSQQWQQDFWADFTVDGARELLIAEGPAGIDGYLALRPGSPTGEAGIMVTEWVDRTPSAFQRLWACLHHLASDRLPVTLPPLPPDRPVMALLPPQADMRPIRSLLLRPGLPDRFWPFVHCRPGQGELCLAVRDPVGLWPERSLLQWADGRVTGRATTASPSIRLDVGTLGLLAFGALTVDEALRLRLAEGSPDSLAALAGLFLAQPIHRFPADSRVGKPFRQW
jgi:hypothetical protein